MSPKTEPTQHDAAYNTGASKVESVGDQKFKVILDYGAKSRSTSIIRNPITYRKGKIGTVLKKWDIISSL